MDYLLFLNLKINDPSNIARFLGTDYLYFRDESDMDSPYIYNPAVNKEKYHACKDRID